MCTLICSRFTGIKHSVHFSPAAARPGRWAVLREDGALWARAVGGQTVASCSARITDPGGRRAEITDWEAADLRHPTPHICGHVRLPPL